MEYLEMFICSNSNTICTGLLVAKVFLYSVQTLKVNLSVLTTESETGAERGDRTQDEEERDPQATVTRVQDSLNDIIALCQRSSQNLDQQQREVVCVCLCVWGGGGE